MPLGPGALSLLLQPTHVQNPAGGDGVFKAAQLIQKKRQDEWYRGQHEKEVAEQTRQFDVSHGLEQQKFDYMGQEKRRLEEMAVYDELLDADASQDPQKMLAAWNKARARGINAPGYEEKINELYKGKPPAAGTAEPADKPTAPESREDQALNKELDKVRSDALSGIQGPFGADIGKNVGQDIGDGWEVVETPAEAKTEGPPMERSPFTGQMAPPVDLGPPPGLAGGLQAQRPPPKPMGPTVVYGSDGKPLGTLDPETATARSRARVGEALAPLVENARTPEEKRAAAIAMDTGQRLVGSMPVDKIVANAQERYDSELGRDTAKTVARGGKEAGVPSAGSGAGSFTEDTGLESQDFRINDAARQIAEGLKRAYNVKALNEATSANATMVANAEARTGVQNLAAVKHMLQITENGRLSNQDLEMALASGGKLNALHAQLMAWTAEGRLPPGYLNSVKAYGKVLQSIEMEKRAEIYEEGRAAIQNNRLFASLSPEDQEWWANWVAGYASNTMRNVKQRKLAKKGKRGGDEASDDDAAADALMGSD